MRTARIRNCENGGGYFHCMSRVVEGRFIFDVGAAGCVNALYFVDLMRKLEKFHDMQIVTYAVMLNHFHLLIREPLTRRIAIEDDELIAKIGELNGSGAAAELAWQLRNLRVELNSPESAEELKGRYLARMGDVSNFMRELKGRFAQWFNRRNQRYGVLWADRFKSVLVEGGQACWTMAAYIDLNAVRAGLVEDPKNYKWCGYGEAIGRANALARAGLMEVFGDRGDVTWNQVAKDYRKLLFYTGEQRQASAGERVRKGIGAEAVKSVQDADGEISLGELVRTRVRYFADELVFGSGQFVERVFEANRDRFGKNRKTGGRKLPGCEMGGLRVMRDLRKQPVG